MPNNHKGMQEQEEETQIDHKQLTNDQEET